jgi:hypothetical protein
MSPCTPSAAFIDVPGPLEDRVDSWLVESHYRASRSPPLLISSTRSATESTTRPGR